MGMLDRMLGHVLGRSTDGGGSGGGGVGIAAVALLPAVIGLLHRPAPGAASPVAGLLDGLTRQGYGEHVRSWIGDGHNQSLPSQAIAEVLGAERIGRIAAEAGIGHDAAQRGLAHLLPAFIDHLTPDGRVPEADEIDTALDDFERQLNR